MTEEEWYARNNCSHAHCPDGCEKPQPFLDESGTMLCGRCSAKYGERVPVVPCNPSTCD